MAKSWFESLPSVGRHITCAKCSILFWSSSGSSSFCPNCRSMKTSRLSRLSHKKRSRENTSENSADGRKRIPEKELKMINLISKNHTNMGNWNRPGGEFLTSTHQKSNRSSKFNAICLQKSQEYIKDNSDLLCSSELEPYVRGAIPLQGIKNEREKSVLMYSSESETCNVESKKSTDCMEQSPPKILENTVNSVGLPDIDDPPIIPSITTSHSDQLELESSKSHKSSGDSKEASEPAEATTQVKEASEPAEPTTQVTIQNKEKKTSTESFLEQQQNLCNDSKGNLKLQLDGDTLSPKHQDPPQGYNQPDSAASQPDFLLSCEFCGKDFSPLTLLERELHVNSCLDDMENSNENCVVCGLDLGFMELHERVSHVNFCLDSSNQYIKDHDESEISDPVSICIDDEDISQENVKSKMKEVGEEVNNEDADMTAEKYRCRICDVDLSEKAVLLRIRHVKKCAQQYGVTAQDVIVRTETATPSKSTNEMKKSPLVQTNLSSFFKRPERSLTDVLMKSAKAHQNNFPNFQKLAGGKENMFRTGNKRKKSRFFSRQKATDWQELVRKCPSFKKIIGTKPLIVIDGFRHACKQLSQHYFLTHFHSDHYVGLTSKFDCGKIYCTPATARLVRLRLKVSSNFLCPLELGQTVAIGNARCTLLDANHCPGAAMVHLAFETGETILHVGDFRWDNDVMLSADRLKGIGPSMHPTVAANAGRRGLVDILYLDTTYCHPKYVFPKQKEVIEAAIQVAERHLAEDSKNTLLLVGAYSLGKERLYIEMATRLGMKVQMDRQRWKTLSCLGWPADVMSLLTTEPADTNLRVVPISHINFKKMGVYLKRKALQGDFHRIIGFQPTGWAFDANRKSLLSVRQSGKFIIYGVPYSEHSSFQELRQCISFLNPSRIIPTVNCSSQKSIQDQIHLLQQKGIG